MAHSGKTMTFATDLVPQEDNIYNLGDSTDKWADAYATNLYGDTVVIDNAVTLRYNTTDKSLDFVFA